MANYVEKERLHAELKAHIEKVREAEAKGELPPIANDYIGRAIINIANGIAMKHNFRDYTWLDEMIGDGIVQCVNAINKYDPDRSSNPFGFFTTTIWWAFLNRNRNEKKKKDQIVQMIRETVDEYYVQDGITEHLIDKEELLKLMDS